MSDNNEEFSMKTSLYNGLYNVGSYATLGASLATGLVLKVPHFVHEVVEYTTSTAVPLVISGVQALSNIGREVTVDDVKYMALSGYSSINSYGGLPGIALGGIDSLLVHYGYESEHNLSKILIATCVVKAFTEFSFAMMGGFKLSPIPEMYINALIVYSFMLFDSYKTEEHGIIKYDSEHSSEHVLKGEIFDIALPERVGDTTTGLSVELSDTLLESSTDYS